MVVVVVDIVINLHVSVECKAVLLTGGLSRYLRWALTDLFKNHSGKQAVYYTGYFHIVYC